MKRIFFEIAGVILLLAGCSTYCNNQMPADMAEYNPDWSGHVLTFSSPNGDTMSLVPTRYFVQHDEEFESCEKCSCSGPGIVQWYSCKDSVFLNPRIRITGMHKQPYYQAQCEWEIGHSRTRYLRAWGVDGNLYITARFDQHGHFVSRDFGDTLVLVKGADTAEIVRGIGLVRMNEYRLTCIADSNGATILSLGGR